MGVLRLQLISLEIITHFLEITPRFCEITARACKIAVRRGGGRLVAKRGVLG